MYVHKTEYEKAKLINNEEVQGVIQCLKGRHDEGQEREKNVQIQKNFNYLCVQAHDSNPMLYAAVYDVDKMSRQLQCASSQKKYSMMV